MLAISSNCIVLVRNSAKTISNYSVKCLSLLVSPLQELNLTPKFADLHLPFAARIHANIWLCIHVSSWFLSYNILSNTKVWANSKNLTGLGLVKVNSGEWEYFFKGPSVSFNALIIDDSASVLSVYRCFDDTWIFHQFIS